MFRFHPLGVLVSTLVLAPVAYAQPAPPLPSDATALQVSAHGEAHRVPDLATFSAGVVTQAADVNAAMRANAQRMSAVIAALRQAGVAERDIQTANLSAEPQYRDGPNQAPKITGYVVTNTVRVRLHELGKAGDVLDALVREGANQIEGPSFTLDQPETALDEARKEAVHQAQARADLYAAATGLKVRRIVSISESGGAMPPPRMLQAGVMRAAAVSTPVAAGENTVTVDLDVVYELGH